MGVGERYVLTDCDMQSSPRNIDALVKAARVLIVDDEYYTRKVIRTLLLAVGVTDVYDANNGIGGLEAIRTLEPDIVILDWQMPGMDGGEFMRQVRSPGNFPFPDVPIIVLTGHGERSRVIEAVRFGVHEYLLKPVSSKALHTRLVSVLSRPRSMVKRGDYYGPAPRKLSSYKPEADSYNLTAEQVVKAPKPSSASPSPTCRIFV
jgi:two-component system, chemotaxis family, chemotaxis protein CheY